MAEQTLVAPGHWVELPDGVDDVTAAAIANPGMSSWAALRESARFQKGESVLVNGGTGTAGRLAIQIAKHLCWTTSGALRRRSCCAPSPWPHTVRSPRGCASCRSEVWNSARADRVVFTL